MARVVSIIISCGSGIATSTHVANAVKEYMAEHKVKVSISTCSVNDLPNRVAGFDLVLTTAKFEFDPGVPVFNGIPLLTGVGDDALLEALKAKVLELSAQ